MKSAACFALLLALGSGAKASAEGIYLTEPQLCAKLFPGAPHIQASDLTLSDAEAAQVSRLYGYRIESHTYRALTVSDDSGVKGTVFILDVMGQNSPITFGVGVTSGGIIRGVEVVAYREPRGEEIRNPRFLRQLQGKSIQDKLALGVDVDAITGATISSRSATFAARKALAIAAVLHERSVAQASSVPRPAAGRPLP
jgi:uncharacterized protein with FMN-binding domain